MRKKILVVGLLFLGLAFLNSCQKDSLVTNVPHNETPDFNWGQGDSIPIVAPFYFTGKIDSQLFVMQDSIDGYLNYVYDSALTQCPNDTSTVFYAQTTGFYTVSGQYSLDIKFLTCVDTTEATGIDSTDLDSLLGGGGTFMYGNSNIFNPINGVEVTWVDGANRIWKTKPGSGAATNDSFFILAITPNPVDGLGFHKITGTMSVTLYNGIETKRIENGQFEMQYGVY